MPLSVTNGAYRLVDMMGTPAEITVTNGRLSLVATRYPQYLTGKDLGLSIVKPSCASLDNEMEEMR